MPLWVPLVVLALAILLIFVGITRFGRAGRLDQADREFRASALHTTAQVVDLNSTRERQVDSFAVYWHPVVAFTTADGRDIRAQAMNGASPAWVKKGQSIDILYDPRHPARVLAMPERSSAQPSVERQLGCFLISMGVLLLPFAALLWWISSSIN